MIAGAARSGDRPQHAREGNSPQRHEGARKHTKGRITLGEIACMVRTRVACWRIGLIPCWVAPTSNWGMRPKKLGMPRPANVPGPKRISQLVGESCRAARNPRRPALREPSCSFVHLLGAGPSPVPGSHGSPTCADYPLPRTRSWSAIDNAHPGTQQVCLWVPPKGDRWSLERTPSAKRRPGGRRRGTFRRPATTCQGRNLTTKARRGTKTHKGADHAGRGHLRGNPVSPAGE